MVQKVLIVDDLDGSEGAETITFGLRGQEYEIDLSEENSEKFRETLQPYIDVSRPVERQDVTSFASQRGARRQTGSRGGSGRDDIPQIRSWAEAQGLEVSSRGRIKQEIIDAYDQAHR